MPTACPGTPSFTAHALSRSAQRAIPPQAVALILDYGTSARTRGADSYFLDHASRQRMQRDLGEQGFRSVERWLNAYAIVADDGRAITTAWRKRRLRRS